MRVCLRRGPRFGAHGERGACAILTRVSALSRRTPPAPTAKLALQAWRNLGAFKAAYAWLLSDLVGFSRRRVAAVVALNLLGVALQWAVLGGVLLFVGELTGEGGAFQAPLLGGLDLEVEATFASVALWGVLVMAAVLGAALSTYGGEAIGFETARRYVERSGRTVLSATLAARRGVDGRDPPARELQRVLARDQTMMLRALLVVQRSLRSGLMVAVAVTVLALINAALTLVVVGVAAFFVLPYYLINRRIVAASAALDRDSSRARASIIRLVDHATAREPSPEIARVVPESYAADRAIADRWATLREILLGRQRTTAVMTGLLGTCLVAIVVTFGLIIARDDASWVAALTFLVALNVASGAFLQLAGDITAANRFLPHIQHFIAYPQRLEHDDKGSTSPLQANAPHVEDSLPPVSAARPSLAGSEREVALAAGSRILCVVPHATDRLNLQTLLGAFVGGSPTHARRLREAAFFHGDPSSLPPVTAQVLLGEHGPSALAALGLADEVDRLPDGHATVLTSEVQERMSGFLRYALGMVEGLAHELVVLGWGSFSRLSPQERRRLLQSLEQQPVLFVTTRAPRRQPAEVTHMAVLTERGVAGMGGAAWYESIAGELRDGGRDGGPGADTTLDDLDDF